MLSVNDTATARSERIARAWNVNPLLAQVIEVLLDLGGSSHRDVVLTEIGWRRSNEGLSDGLRREVLDAFAAHCSGAEKSGKPALLRPAFGPDSRRWELTPEVKLFIVRTEAESRRERALALAAGGLPTAQPDAIQTKASGKLLRLPRRAPRLRVASSRPVRSPTAG